MDPVSAATVSNASGADLGSVQGAAAILMLRRSLDSQAALSLQQIQALPQPALATSGTLGTQVNTYV